MAEHTSGPMHLDHPIHADVIDDDYHCLDVGGGYLSDGFTIQTVISTADAKRIQTCWNAHDALVEALKKYRDKFHACAVFVGSDPEIVDCACADADAALALARGEPS